jgi:hypothetical protein
MSFALKALGELFLANLDRDDAIQPRVTCLIDLAHATCTERRSDLIRA